MDETVHEKQPVAPGVAVGRLARCVVTTASLMARRRVHQPRQHVGSRLTFADGTTGVVYRETVLDRGRVAEPAVLLVEFRLRGVRGRGHALFRAESTLNTPLFAGFPGFVSKLWLANDEHGRYRGLYQWDSPQLAEDYVLALWWVLALVSHRDSIHYRLLPGLWRDEVLRDPGLLATSASPQEGDGWSRLTHTEPVPA
jgi:hypothetical protein